MSRELGASTNLSATTRQASKSKQERSKSIKDEGNAKLSKTYVTTGSRNGPGANKGNVAEVVRVQVPKPKFAEVVTRPGKNKKEKVLTKSAQVVKFVKSSVSPQPPGKPDIIKKIINPTIAKPKERPPTTYSRKTIKLVTKEEHREILEYLENQERKILQDFKVDNLFGQEDQRRQSGLIEEDRSQEGSNDQTSKVSCLEESNSVDSELRESRNLSLDKSPIYFDQGSEIDLNEGISPNGPGSTSSDMEEGRRGKKCPPKRISHSGSLSNRPIHVDENGKPRCTYTDLIEKALREHDGMTVSEIYHWISKNYPFFDPTDDRWKNSVRHNLSINPYFKKGSKAKNGSGHTWTISEEGRGIRSPNRRSSDAESEGGIKIQNDTDRAIANILKQFSLANEGDPDRNVGQNIENDPLDIIGGVNEDQNRFQIQIPNELAIGSNMELTQGYFVEYHTTADGTYTFGLGDEMQQDGLINIDELTSGRIVLISDGLDESNKENQVHDFHNNSQMFSGLCNFSDEAGIFDSNHLESTMEHETMKEICPISYSLMDPTICQEVELDNPMSSMGDGTSDFMILELDQNAMGTIDLDHVMEVAEIPKDAEVLNDMEKDFFEPSPTLGLNTHLVDSQSVDSE